MPQGGYPGHNLAVKQVVMGDEAGVQGRFFNNVSQVLTSAGAIYFNNNISYADYEATNDRTLRGKVPDVVGMGSNGGLRIIGEIKTPWISAHNLSDACEAGRTRLDRIFGQVARYMRLAHVKYGYVSTYERTIFLRQVVVNGRWQLQYSPPIIHSAKSGNQLGQVTAREAFWYLTHLADAGHVAMNSTPMANWAA